VELVSNAHVVNLEEIALIKEGVKHNFSLSMIRRVQHGCILWGSVFEE
jgi:hypothetical protein